MLTLRGLAVSLLALWLLAGCSQLPNSGPRVSSMLAAEGRQHNLAVVEIDPATIGLLSMKQEPSFFGAFGDYRPSVNQMIGIGDMLQVTLWESSGGGLFSNPVAGPYSAGSHSAVIPEQTVGRDGSITVPFAGRVPVVGRTPSQVEGLIKVRLADMAVDPQVLVTITHNFSNTATVLSEGGLSARVPLSLRGDRLLEVLAQSGGIRAAASDTSVVLSRGDRIVHVPLEAVLSNPREDIYVQPGDVVTQVYDPQSFTAIGATGRNNVVKFGTAELNLDEALGKAGGLLDNRADPAGVFVIRFETGAMARVLAQSHDLTLERGDVPAIYHLNMRDPSAFFLAKKFSIRDKDIIYVANAPFVDVQKVLGMVNQLIAPVFTGLLLNTAVP